MHTPPIYRLILGMLAMTCSTVCHAQNEAGSFRRVALVVGNAEYGQASLQNPVQDAQLIANSLSEIGFEVTTKFNRGKYELESDIDEITQGLKRGDAIFFFYAGHGVEVDKQNFMIPTDAEISRSYHMRQRCVSVDFVLEAMQDSDASLKVVILDACRDNPFRSFTRSSSQGLAAIEAPEGTIVAFSTAPGKVALDGDGGNSPFTKHLASALRSQPEQGLEVNAMFTTVARAVKKETGQRAFVNSDRSMEPYHLTPPAKLRPSKKEAEQTAEMSVDRSRDRPVLSPKTISWQQAWDAVNNYLREHDLNICGIKAQDAAYAALINRLSEDQKHAAGGSITLCFPSQETWNSRPDIAAEMVATLRRMRILLESPEQQPPSNEPSFEEVWAALRKFVVTHPFPVAGFADRFPEYKALLSSVDQRHSVGGVPMAFPSKEAWESDPNFRADIIRVFRKNGLLSQE